MHSENMSKNCQKCCYIATISITVCEIHVAENDGDSRYWTQNGNSSLSAHAVTKWLKSLEGVS